MYRKILVNGESIEYYYKYKNIKRINLRVNKDAQIMVSAPKLVKLDRLDEFVATNSKWIKDKKKFILNSMMQDTGEDNDWMYHLGKKYPVQIEKAVKTDIRLGEDKFHLKVHIPLEKLDVKSTIRSWRKFSAFYICNSILKRLYPLIADYVNTYPNLKIRTTTSRWGSYSKHTNSVMINSELVKYPVECVEFVIMHELCHLKYLNHSSDFYNLFYQVMPDYKEREKILKKFK